MEAILENRELATVGVGRQEQGDHTMPRTQGRCPHCGESVMVEVTKGQQGEILEHRCQARACAYSGCRVLTLRDEMVRFAPGKWYCPSHGLLVLAKDLVSLYRVEGDVDWTAISEILGEGLPDIVAKAEARTGHTVVKYSNVRGLEFLAKRTPRSLLDRLLSSLIESLQLVCVRGKTRQLGRWDLGAESRVSLEVATNLRDDLAVGRGDAVFDTPTESRLRQVSGGDDHHPAIGGVDLGVKPGEMCEVEPRGVL